MYIFVLGVYVFTSILFFKYPTLIREKKKLKFQCKHISHRGGNYVHFFLITIYFSSTGEEDVNLLIEFLDSIFINESGVIVSIRSP